MVEQGFSQFVRADAGVQAVLGSSPTRFYPAVAPENPTYPYGIFRVVSNTPLYDLKGGVRLNSIRIQVDTVDGGPDGASYADAKAAQAAIVNCLQPNDNPYVGLFPDGTIVSGIFVSNAHDGYDQDARAYRTVTDFVLNYYPA